MRPLPICLTYHWRLPKFVEQQRTLVPLHLWRETTLHRLSLWSRQERIYKWLKRRDEVNIAMMFNVCRRWATFDSSYFYKYTIDMCFCFFRFLTKLTLYTRPYMLRKSQVSMCTAYAYLIKRSLCFNNDEWTVLELKKVIERNRIQKLHLLQPFHFL